MEMVKLMGYNDPNRLTSERARKNMRLYNDMLAIIFQRGIPDEGAPPRKPRKRGDGYHSVYIVRRRKPCIF